MRESPDRQLHGRVGATALAEARHDVECVVDWPMDPGDAAVLSHAQNTGQVVLTLDKDFGELIVVRASLTLA